MKYYDSFDTLSILSEKKEIVCVVWFMVREERERVDQIVFFK